MTRILQSFTKLHTVVAMDIQLGATAGDDARRSPVPVSSRVVGLVRSVAIGRGRVVGDVHVGERLLGASAVAIAVILFWAIAIPLLKAIATSLNWLVNKNQLHVTSYSYLQLVI